MQFKMVASVRTVRKLIQYIIPLYEHVKKKGRNLERGGNKMAINKGELAACCRARGRARDLSSPHLTVIHSI